MSIKWHGGGAIMLFLCAHFIELCSEMLASGCWKVTVDKMIEFTVLMCMYAKQLISSFSFQNSAVEN